MKKITKYIARSVMAAAVALILSVVNIGIILPINILTVASSVIFGIPGILLSIILCNYIF